MKDTSLTANRDSNIVAQYNAGEKIAHIALSNGVSEVTVLKVIRSARPTGAVTREALVKSRGNIEPGRNQRIVEMYMTGSTLNSIGEYFGLTRERVRQILDEANIDRRTVTEHVDVAKAKAKVLYGSSIEAAFEESRSIAKVAEQFKDRVPSRWV